MQLVWTTHFYAWNEVQEVKNKHLIRGSKAKNHFSLVLIMGGEEQTQNPHTDQELPQNKPSQHIV